MRPLAAILALACAAPASANEEWGGFYVGFFGGYSNVNGTDNWGTPVLLGTASGAENVISDAARWGTGELGIALTLPPDGFTGGIFAGHNWVVSDRIIASVEGGLSFGSYDTTPITTWATGHSFGTAAYSNEFTSGYHGGASLDLSARLGLLIDEQTLIFGSLGGSVDSSSMDIAFEIEEDVYALPAQYTYMSGTTVRALSFKPAMKFGVERALADRLRLRAEYEVRFSPRQRLATDINFIGGGANAGIAPDPVFVDVGQYFTHSVRVGLSYAF